MAAFTEAGVDPKVQARILTFLNSAQTAADISGREPQEGPVHDYLSLGYGDQMSLH